MKNVVSYLVLALILINCQEPKENLAENKFSKNVGQKIPIDVAERWAARSRKNNRLSKTQEMGSISANTLRNLTASLNDYNGMIFHHALDDQGRYHTLLIPFLEGVPLWNTMQIVDAENDSPVEADLARDWAENYIDQNPHGIWSHFFGSHIFNTILSRTTFERMDLVHGSNDSNQPQILLYVIYSEVTQNGRSGGETVEVYDMSSPCPAYCAL